MLAQEEMKALLQGAESRKHRAMLMLLAYSLNEVLALTSADIDNKLMALHTRSGKGKRDRNLAAARVIAAPAPRTVTEVSPHHVYLQGPVPQRALQRA